VGQLTKWDTEIRGEPKRDPYFKIAGKHLEFQEPLAEQSADTGSDLKLANALTRRGRASELAQIMSYNVHDNMMKMFIQEYARPPIPGYAKISSIQIKNTYKEVLVRLAAQHVWASTSEPMAPIPWTACCQRF